ncbi:MAG TPA: hypothetical protein P5244_16065 [Syntrophales bacterium]|nr:hypothetical protein [Syntrophales bacterium]HRR42747.1 hypothetical protein [Syntrophales bacterium]
MKKVMFYASQAAGCGDWKTFSYCLAVVKETARLRGGERRKDGTVVGRVDLGSRVP